MIDSFPAAICSTNSFMVVLRNTMQRHLYDDDDVDDDSNTNN